MDSLQNWYNKKKFLFVYGISLDMYHNYQKKNINANCSFKDASN